MLYSIIYLSLILAPASNMGQMKMNLEVKGEDYSIYAKTKIVELKNLRASEIEPFVRARLSQYGAVQINDALNMLIITDREPKLTDLVNLVKELDKRKIKNFLRLETAVLPLKNVSPSSVVDVIKERLSPDGFVQANNDLNILVITDVSTKIEEAKRILSLIDLPPKQIMVEGQVIEMDDNYARSLGLDIFGVIKNVLPKGVIDFNFKMKGRTQYSDTSKSVSWGVSGYTSYHLIESLEQAIKKGKAKLLQNLSLSVLNNKRGTIKLQSNDTRISRSTSYRYQYGSWNNGIYESRDEREDYRKNDIYISIIPRIGKDGNIILVLDVQGGNQNDNKSTYLSTTVKVKDGETITLGGMKVDIVDTEDNGIPLLKEIPILGYLFKREVKTHTIKDIAVIITPHIVK